MPTSGLILRSVLAACLLLSAPVSSSSAQDLTEEEVVAVTDWLFQGRTAYIKIYDAYFNLRSANAALNEYYLDERSAEQALNSYDFRRRNYEEVLASAKRLVNRMPSPPKLEDEALSGALGRYISFLGSSVDGVEDAGALVAEMRAAVAAQDKDSFADLTARSFNQFSSIIGAEDLLADMSLMAVSPDQPQYAVMQAIRYNNRAIGELTKAAGTVYGAEPDDPVSNLSTIGEVVAAHLEQARAFILSGQAVNEQNLVAARGQRRLLRQIATSIHDSYESSFKTEEEIALVLEAAAMELTALDQGEGIDFNAMLRGMAEFNVQLQPLMDERIDTRGNRQDVMGRMR